MGLGSGIRKKPIPDPGSGPRGQKGTGYRIRIRNTGKNIKLIGRRHWSRIQNPGSDFFHPGSRIQGRQDPKSGSTSKNLSIFNPKTDTGTKFSKIRSGKFIPDPVSGFFSIRGPRSRGQKSTRSLIRIRNTAYFPHIYVWDISCLPGSVLGVKIRLYRSYWI